MPAPAMRTCRDRVSSIGVAEGGVAGASGGQVDIQASRGLRFRRLQLWRIAIERRAIGADFLIVVTHVEEHMRMVERRVGAGAHEFLDTDVDRRIARIVLEMGNGTACHRRLLHIVQLHLDHNQSVCKIDEMKLSQKPVRG
ncbi:hypothetical protein MESS4_510167 [Mesorhizobium sp. STM 4661]|nr:hypothetical protein MESS4_510167 [Mesorhizobium sp. STM 4661]